MKEVKETKGKNPTTNYPKDTHKAFCERCFEYNGGCPNTNTKHKDLSCSL